MLWAWLQLLPLGRYRPRAKPEQPTEPAANDPQLEACLHEARAVQQRAERVLESFQERKSPTTRPA